MTDARDEPVRPSDHGSGGPDPFSREGAAAGAPDDGPARRGEPPAPAEDGPYPVYGQDGPAHPGDPAAPTGSHAPDEPAPPYQPPPQQGPAQQAPWGEQQAPWADPQQPPTSYGSAADPYGSPDPYSQGTYGQGSYGQGSYGQPAPYGGGYGQPAGYGYGYGYGYGPVDHPKAVPALITGIIGLVLSLGCGVGGLVGIAGIVLGGRAKREIDGDPARWTGRGKANAGLVTGVVGLVILALWTLLFVVVGISDS